MALTMRRRAFLSCATAALAAGTAHAANLSILNGTPVTGALNLSDKFPLGDPSNPNANLIAGPQQIAATLSPVVVTLSSLNIVSDATNGLTYGSTAPAGATGQEAAINAALAAAWTAAGLAPLRIIWDVAVALGGPIYFPGSNTEIFAPSKACGAIMRSLSNCPMFRSPGFNTSTGAILDTQNSFGKFDPGAPLGSHNYRVFDPAFVASVNLAWEGGTWNGNSPQQTGGSSGNQSSTYGFNSLSQFWGVEGLRIENVTCLLANAFNIHVANTRNFTYDKLLVDAAVANFNADGIHINGPTTGIRGGAMRYHGNDDNLALNADDGGNSGVLVCGTNYPCGGNITDAYCKGPDIWNGHENTTSIASVRLLSNYHLIDNVTIDGCTGLSTTWSSWVIPWSTPLCPGSGNYGHVIIINDDHDCLSPSLGGGVFDVDGVIEMLEFRSRTRINAASAFPDINIQATAVIAKLVVDWKGHQAAGATNNTQPAILCAGSIGQLIGRFSRTSDSSLSINAAPFLKTVSGASITMADLWCDGDSITNLVSNVSGATIAALFLNGSHTNSGGGSPLANAGTVTNYVPGDQSNKLVWKTGVASFSGSSPTHVNAYSGP